MATALCVMCDRNRRGVESYTVRRFDGPEQMDLCPACAEEFGLREPKENPYANLPKVVAILGIDDSGEFGAATCPHCGAEGRYIYRLLCEDGNTWGAMAGCASRFPQHPAAKVIKRILDKQKEYKKAGWNLPSWDAVILTAVAKLEAKEITVEDLQATIANEERRRRAFQDRKYGRAR